MLSPSFRTLSSPRWWPGWPVVKQLCATAREEFNPDAEGTTILLFNEWLAKKRLAGTAAISRDVENFDDSALHPRFGLVRLALLDRLDDLTGALPAALDSNIIGMWDIHHWPVLEELRQTPTYAELIATREPWRDTDMTTAPQSKQRRRRAPTRPTKFSGVSANAEEKVH